MAKILITGSEGHGVLGALLDRVRNLVRLAVADADVALLVADDRQRREAEAAATLDHLGAAVDEDDLLDHRGTVARVLGLVAAVVAAGAALAASVAVTALGAVRIGRWGRSCRGCGCGGRGGCGRF